MGRADHSDSDVVALGVDAATFEIWFSTYSPLIFGYAARRLGRQLAEDICAQTFAEAWAHIDRFDPHRGAPKVWLLGIATNLIRQHHRAEERQLRAYHRTGIDPEVQSPELGVVNRLDAIARWRLITEQLANLRPKDRDVIWLAASTDLTMHEIAVATDLPVGTVKSRLSRTRARLARIDAPTPRQAQ